MYVLKVWVMEITNVSEPNVDEQETEKEWNPHSMAIYGWEVRRRN